jgi:NAD(P)-dependent dehydrogenase (short-subunit alcohol dehydrogenase family)
VDTERAAGEGPVVVVTGVGSRAGIGWAICQRLRDDGWRVLASDVRDPGELDGVAFAPADVRDPEAVEALADAALERFGRLDGWVNNAGVNKGLVPLVDVSDEDWRLNQEVVAGGTFHGCRAAVPRILAGGRGWGRIVNVSSQAGKHGFASFSAYCAAKFAVIGITEALAKEVAGKGITVNAVCPGTVDTPLLEQEGGVWELMANRRGITPAEYKERATRGIPIGRLLRPEEIANSVAFLFSREADALTGLSLNVTGGESLF